jgi:hypothetical protein
MVTSEVDRPATSAGPRDGFRPLLLESAKRRRNDEISSRSPLMDGWRIECQNTPYGRNLLQIEDYVYANAPFDSRLEPRFS